MCRGFICIVLVFVTSGILWSQHRPLESDAGETQYFDTRYEPISKEFFYERKQKPEWLGIQGDSINQKAARENAIKISSPHSEKVVVIKENKRIKIRTVDGQKLSGRFEIVDSQSIFVDNQQVDLRDITEVKRNPLSLSIFSSSFLIYAGAITAGMGALIGLFAEASGFLLIIPGGALIFAGIKSPNVLKNYKSERDWNFELITTN